MNSRLRQNCFLDKLGKEKKQRDKYRESKSQREKKEKKVENKMFLKKEINGVRERKRVVKEE